MEKVLSVVLPVYNEEENLEPLLARLTPVLEKAASGRFEILFVDDGSRDNTAQLLEQAHASDPRIKVIHFSRNFGHQAALQAGLDHASGDAVALMDADLQDPPELLEEFVRQWHNGFHVVYAVRHKRKESPLKRACYSVFYRTVRAIAEIDMPLDSGDFCLLDREVVNVLTAMRERNRFLRGLRSWVGFRQVGVQYEREARHAGTPKYTLRKLVRLALSGYVGFSSMPLRMSSWLGCLAAIGGLGMAGWAIGCRLAGVATPPGWASLMSVVLFVGGVQLVMLGVIGEYLGRVYDDVRGRPLYLISGPTGFESQAGSGDNRPAFTGARNAG